MSDDSSTVPVWLTIFFSIVTSGVFSAVISAMIAAYYEQKKQGKQLRLERMERALVLLRGDYDKAAGRLLEVVQAPRVTSTKLGITGLDDLDTAIMMSAPDLWRTLDAYWKTRVKLEQALQSFPSRVNRKAWDDRMAAARRYVETMRTTHDHLKMALLVRCHRILGVNNGVPHAVERSIGK